MAEVSTLLLISVIVFGGGLAQDDGSGGGGFINIFFAVSDITISEGQQAPICVLADGFTSELQTVRILQNYTFLSASRGDFATLPPSNRIIAFTMNRSMDCVIVQASRDNTTESREEMVLFTLMNLGGAPAMLRNPMLTLTIQADPPMITVPEFVDASAGNAAVVCFTAIFPTGDTAMINLSAVNISAGGNEDYDVQSLPQTISFSSSQSLRQCARIRTFNRTNGVNSNVRTFSIHVSPINESMGSLPVLSRSQVTVRLQRQCLDGDVRLVNGSDDSQGRVEFCFRRSFVTPCDVGVWTINDATTVCRQLGFSGPVSIPTSTATFGTGSGPFQSSLFTCGPSTTDFQFCLRTEVGFSTCKPNLGVFCGCTENSLRIVPLRFNGNSPTEGRLEICRNNRWGTVCSQGWDDSDAAVACRQLDIQSEHTPSVLMLNDSLFAGGTGPIFLNDVQCTGSELNISSCVFSKNTSQCSHNMDAGVRCDAPPIFRGCPSDQFQCDSEQICLNRSRLCDGIPDCISATSLSSIIALDEQNCTECSGNEIRPLIGGNSPQEGLVEVCLNGIFHRVVLSSVTVREASVMCRQLQLGSAGFPFSSTDLLRIEASSLIHQATNGVTITCTTGNERSLQECALAVRQVSSLRIFEFAAIKCIEASSCTDGMTRLVPRNPPKKGEMPREGRLEICYRGIWGSVYDTDWTGLDAAVTCQDLGFDGFSAIPILSAYYPFDPTFLPIVYDLPRCTSLVSGSILNCSRVGSPPRSLPSMEVQATPATATATAGPRRTRRQLPPRQLLPAIVNLGLLLSSSIATPYSFLVGVRCDSSVPVGQVPSSNQEELRIRCFYENDCGGSGAFIGNSEQDCCNRVSQNGRRVSSYSDPQNQCFRCPQTPSGPSSDFNCTREGDLRLVIREESTQEGLLQVCKDGLWNFMCGDSVSRTTARVSCRQLGFSEFRLAQPRTLTSNPPVSNIPRLPIRLDISCEGFERNLAMCTGLSQNSSFCTGSVTTLSCPSLPTVRFNEPVFSGNFTTDLRRSSFQCLTNRADYPRAANITISRNNILSRTTFNAINVFSTRLTVNDSGTYNCTVRSIAGSSTRTFEVIVQGGTGAITSTGFLRMSSINLQRQPPPALVEVGRPRTNTEMLEELVFGALLPVIPGQQTVMCDNVTRSSMDVERRLDRFECVIVTRGGSTGANAGALVAQAAANFIQIVSPGIFSDFETSSVGFCDSNKTVYNNRCLEWPETIAGRTAMVACPGATGNATRWCGTDTVWSAPDLTLCELAINIVSNALQQSISTDNYNSLTDQVTVAIETASNDSAQQSVMLVESISNYFGNISTLVGTESGVVNPPISLAVVRSLSRGVARLQLWPANLYVANPYSSRVLLSLESIAAQYAQIVPVNQTIIVQEENFVLVAENAPVSVLRETGRVVSFENTALPSRVGSRRLADNQVASIALPPSMFDRITDRTQVGVFFALYNENTLFPVREEVNVAGGPRGTTVVGSPVVAATVGPRLSFNGLQTPVQINLRLMSSPDSIIREGSQTCVSWDFNEAGGNGNWSTAGCTTSITCDGIVQCNCTHLTNFAVLVDICSRVDPGRCTTNPIFEEALSVITIVGASLSMVGILITVITLLAFKKLRGRDTTVYHVQLCVAVFFMLLVFVTGINRVTRVGGCVLVSLLIHYFTLAAIFWMSAEAALMFQKLVLVFKAVTKKIMIVTSLVCWLAPLLFVIPPFVADLANGGEPSDDLVINRSQFCFLSNAVVFWLTFLVPILILITCNSIIFCMVIVILIKHTRGTLTRTKEAIQTKTVVRLLISTSGVLFLFGISWIFAALTITVPGIRLPAQVLFVIFNSLQGFFIFLFFCILSKEARESWKEVLSCGRYKSSFLNPSLRRGKNSSGGQLTTNGKHKTTTSNYISTKNTYNSSVSHGRSEYSNLYSGREEKINLSDSQGDKQNGYSVPKPARSKGDNSSVDDPAKEDISVADPNPNVYTSLVAEAEQGGGATDNQVYLCPMKSSSSSTSNTPGGGGVYVNSVEIRNQNRNELIASPNAENETEFSK